MTVRITGTGSLLPARAVGNREISQLVETSDEWIRERTGIEARRVSEGETVADLAAGACRNALENAGKRPEDVELLLVATCSPEMALPCCACQVQSLIGAEQAVAFDVNAACAGFLFALHTAYAYLQAGIYKNALIVGAEVLSKIVDWTDRGTCILFGDGAGAVLVEREERIGQAETTERGNVTESSAVSEQIKDRTAMEGILGFVQHSDGRKGHVLQCETRSISSPFYTAEPGNPYVQMDGREIFQFATRQVPASIQEALQKTGLSADEIDYFVLHQANARIIEMIAKRMKQPMEKFPMNLQAVGNTSSAAIPLLLDELNRAGKLERGMKLVLSGFGAGLTYGACVMIW